MRASSLAARLQLTLLGSDLELESLSELSEARFGELGLCLSRSYLSDAALTQASALICAHSLQSELIERGWGREGQTLLVAPVEATTQALLGALLRAFHAERAAQTGPAQHPSALIHPSASVGPFVVVEAGASLAEGARVEAYAYVGEGARVEAGAELGVRASLLAGCSIAAGAIIGPGAVIGGRGFGLDHEGLVPHLGRVEIGAGVSVGALSCVDRATLGVTRVKAGAQLDNLVQVAHNATVGEGAVLCAQVGLAGGAEVEGGATLGGQVGVNNRAKVGARARVAAQSGVTRDLPPDGAYSGHPAEPNTPRLRRELRLRQLASQGGSSARVSVHPSAQLHPSVELGEGVEIGAWVKLGAGVKLGRGAVIGARSQLDEGCRLEPYAVVGERVWLQEGCELSSFAVVGARAQTKTSTAQPMTEERAEGGFELVCGPRSQFREGCTVSRGAPALGEGVTRVGAGCLLMAYSHVGHDSQLGAGCVLANQVSLAGHVKLGDGVSLGGHAAVHQFVQIGELAFIAANAMVSGDVPPYCLAAGDHATLRGLNSVGLRRAGLSEETRAQLKLAYHELLRGRAVAGGLSAIPEAERSEALRRLIASVAASSARPRCRVAR